MITCKCIQKFRDKNNVIYGYRLVDSNGNTRDIVPDQLKQAIKNKQVYVNNLTLTADNRLIDKSIDQPQNKKVLSKETEVTKPVATGDKTNKDKSIIHVTKHQPLFHTGIIEKLPTCTQLKFKVVESFDGFLAKAKVLGVDINIVKLTDDIYMIEDKNAVIIISKIPVRILEDNEYKQLSMYKEIDFRNADLSRIKSLDNVINTEKVTDLTGTNFDLNKIKRINSSVISRYRYSDSIIDLLDNSKADSYIDIAYKIFNLLSWTLVDEHPGSGEFDWIINGLVRSVGSCVGFNMIANYELRDVLIYNWNNQRNNADMDYYNDLAAWAISRMIASNNFMEYLNKLLDKCDAENLIYLSLNEESLKIALDNGMIELEEVIEYIENYGTEALLSDISEVISCFKTNMDNNAFNFFKRSYDCVNKLVSEFN